MANAITHYWGHNAQSPCGLPVAMAYSTNDIAFTSEWIDVNCPACARARDAADQWMIERLRSAITGLSERDKAIIQELRMLNATLEVAANRVGDGHNDRALELVQHSITRTKSLIEAIEGAKP